MNDDEVRDRLRQAGMRATAPRLTVHRVLAQLGGHRSADEVHAALADAGDPLPRSSVYNALDALQAAGLVMLADAGPGHAVYEAATVWHHHFVCRRCGVVQDIACVVGAKPCLTPATEGLLVDEAQVIFRGLCASCAADAGVRPASSPASTRPRPAH